MNRLFAFGCSYTNYRWPMWPWMLVENYDQVYNYGNSGAGNDYIFLSIIDAIKCHDINSNDTVVILWSSYFRQDFLREDTAWVLKGNVFNQYDTNFLENMWSLRYSVKKLASYIQILIELFKSKNIKFVFGGLTNLRFLPSDNNENSPNLTIDAFRYLENYLQFDLSSNHFIKKDFISYQQSILENTHEDHYFVCFADDQEPTWDLHPTLLETLDYTKNFICPALGIDLNLNQDIVYKIHNFINETKIAKNVNFSECLNNISWQLGKPIPLDKNSFFKYFNDILYYDRNRLK